MGRQRSHLNRRAPRFSKRCFEVVIGHHRWAFVGRLGKDPDRRHVVAGCAPEHVEHLAGIVARTRFADAVLVWVPAQGEAHVEPASAQHRPQDGSRVAVGREQLLGSMEIELLGRVGVHDDDVTARQGWGGPTDCPPLVRPDVAVSHVPNLCRDRWLRDHHKQATLRPLTVRSARDRTVDSAGHPQVEPDRRTTCPGTDLNQGRLAKTLVVIRWVSQCGSDLGVHHRCCHRAADGQ